MPNANMGLEEKGFKHADIQRANRRMTCLRAMPKAWKAVAEQQEKLAEESAAMGNMVTAGAFYHRAALYYGKAQLYHHKDDAMKLELHASCVRCYEKAIAGYDYTIKRVVLPFEGKNIYGIFHAPKGALNLPTVLFTPGMDMIKEDYPNLNDNFFVRRNMCVLVMDGPGFGETRVHGLPVTLTNYPEAASLFLDWLCGRPEVNPDQIGIFGGSMVPTMVLRLLQMIPGLRQLWACWAAIWRRTCSLIPASRDFAITLSICVIFMTMTRLMSLWQR